VVVKKRRQFVRRERLGRLRSTAAEQHGKERTDEEGEKRYDM
jgi:hypothetical protein